MNPSARHPAGSTHTADPAGGKGTSAYATCRLWRDRARQYPSDPATLCGLAQALLNSGQYQEAEFTARAALAIAPDNPIGLHLLGRMLQHRGAHPAAIAQFRHALTLGGDAADIWNQIGESLTALGDARAAQDAFRNAIRTGARHIDAHFNLGKNLLNDGVPREAVRCFATTVQLAPDNSSAWLMLGTTMARLGRTEPARRALARCVRLDPACERGHLHLGLAWQRLERHDQAVASLVKACELTPSAPALAALANSLCASGDIAASVATYRKALAIEPANHRFMDELSMTLLKAGQPREALATSDSRLALAPANTTTLAARAIALQRSGSDNDELLDFNRLVKSTLLATPSGYASLSAFNAMLASCILSHPTLRRNSGAHHMHGGRQTSSLLKSPLRPLQDLANALDGAVRAYAREHSLESGHAFLDQPLTHWRLSAFGVVLESKNTLSSHIRAGAWLRAVYHVLVPSVIARGPGPSGWIQLGFAPDTIDPDGCVPGREYRPQEGLLLLFPSYLYCQTKPFISSEPFVSVMIDIARPD